MTTSTDLILEVSEDLQDQWSGDEFSRWSSADLLKYLNDAEKVIVTYNPQSYISTAVYILVAGTKQTLPDGTSSFQSPAAVTHPKAIELIKIHRNMGITGLVAGTTITPIGPRDMDEVYPLWRSVTASATVVHYMFDKEDRTRFEVYPPQPTVSMGYIEAVYSAVPTVITTGGNVNLGDEYLPALRAYMRYRAYSVDAQNSQGGYARSLDAWGMFLSLIGQKENQEKSNPTKPVLVG
jgi:hypothetical protein